MLVIVNSKDLELTSDGLKMKHGTKIALFLNFGKPHKKHWTIDIKCCLAEGNNFNINRKVKLDQIPSGIELNLNDIDIPKVADKDIRSLEADKKILYIEHLFAINAIEKLRPLLKGQFFINI